MNILLIIVVVLVLWGTVMWVKPSARDKQLARLRQQARLKGVSVKLVDQSLTQFLPDELVQRGGLAAYWLNFDLSKLFNGRPPCFIFVDKDGGCVGLDDDHHPELPLESIVSLLKGETIGSLNGGVFFSQQGVAFIWREKGEDALVDEIQSVLGKIKEVCGG